jgi:betaine-aldehyde dehydrogenase
MRGRLDGTLSVFDDAIETFLAVAAQELRPDRNGRSTVISRDPVGVVAAITPFNGPFVMSVSKAVRALMAGCSVVLKPALEGALQAYFLADAFEAVGFPPGVISMLAGDATAGSHLVDHDGVDMVTFTGSTTAGRRVAAACGQRLKRSSLELGGKSAAVILDDADLDAVIPVLQYGAFGAAGQVCIALSRVLAPKSRYDEVVDRLVAAAQSLTPGDPFDPATTIGPLITQRQRERVEYFVHVGRSECASLATGGKRPAALDKGWFLEPTVFAHVDNQMRVAREEIFGPVTCVIPYESEADAVATANDSPYGLHGVIFAADVARGLEVARQIRSGTLAVNGFAIPHSAPFGGVKDSGWGREGGPEGIADFIEYKAVSIDSSAAESCGIALSS